MKTQSHTTEYPRAQYTKELEDETLIKWQKAWEESPKAALTKQFFPSISDRIKAKIKNVGNHVSIDAASYPKRTDFYPNHCKNLQTCFLTFSTYAKWMWCNILHGISRDECLYLEMENLSIIYKYVLQELTDINHSLVLG